MQMNFDCKAYTHIRSNPKYRGLFGPVSQSDPNVFWKTDIVTQFDSDMTFYLA